MKLTSNSEAAFSSRDVHAPCSAKYLCRRGGRKRRPLFEMIDSSRSPAGMTSV
jgi:hypothetical protein